MVGRLHNKKRKAEQEEQERRAKVKPVDMSLVARSVRAQWDTEAPIGDTRLVACACGRKMCWHLAGATHVTFKCTKCGGRQTLIR